MAQSKEYYHDYYLKNRDKIRARNKAYSLTNLEKMREYRREYHLSHKKERTEYQQLNYHRIFSQRKQYLKSLTFERRKWYDYRSSAKKRGVDFLLSFDEFSYLINAGCHFCEKEKGGIDRKDSRLGYSRENCLPCCQMCNRMKNDFDYNEFILRCKEIAARHQTI